MFRSLWSGASGMHSQQKNMDVISNNLANVNTNGYKQSRAEFEDLLYSNLERADSPAAGDRSTPAGIQLGHGSRLSATLRDFSTGSITETDQTFDLAIEGDGFFEVRSADGQDTHYTRDGSFKIDGEGNLVTSNGLMVESFDGEIPEGFSEISIGPEGVVNGIRADDGETEELGQFSLTTFQNPAGLEAIGDNLYNNYNDDATGMPQQMFPGEFGTGTLRQGFLESSNVNIAEEMVSMITAQRAYETNSKSIQTTDEMMGMANNLRR